MLLRDLTSGKVSASMNKVICDLTMYEMAKELKLDKMNKIKDSLANTYVHEFGPDMVDEYMARLGSIEYLRQFKEIYDNFIVTLDINGFNQVLMSSSLLTDDVYRFLKKSRGLFGPTLDNAVRKQVEYVANNFKFAEWDVNSHPNCFGLLHSAVTLWTSKGDYKTDKFFSNLQTNIVSNNEGGIFVNDGVEVSHNDTSDLYNPDLYVELMSSIYGGSAELFKLAGSSTLKELLYSTVNYYQEQELRVILESMPAGSPEIIVDQYSLIPYKNKKNLSFSEGHLPHIISGYSSSGIGNENSCNDTYVSGLERLKVIDSGLNNIDFSLPVTFIVSKITKNWTMSMYGDLSQVGVANIIAAILNTRRLKDILAKASYSLLQFPTIELRQDTWQRFSNLYELLNFYRTHTQLDRKLIADEFEIGGQSEIPNSAITVANIVSSKNVSGSDNVDRYIEDNFGNIKLTCRTLIKTRASKITYRPSNDAEKVEEAIWITLKDDIIKLRGCIDKLSMLTGSANFSTTMSFLECMIVPVLKYAGPGLENYSISESSILELYRTSDDNKLPIDYALQDRLFKQLSVQPTTPDAFKTVCTTVNTLLLSNISAPLEFYKVLEKFNEKIHQSQKALLIKNDFYVSDGSGVSTSSINYINLMNYRMSKYLLNKLIELLMDICNTDEIFGKSAEDLSDNVFNNMFKSLTDVVLHSVSRDNIKSIASGNISDIVDDFTKWYSKQYKLDLTSMYRFKEFKHFDLHPYNLDAISLMSRIFKLLLDYSDKFLYGNLTKAISATNSLSTWDSVKEFLNASFLQASIHHLEDEIQQQSMSYSEETFGLKICPTIAGTTIIADPRNLKRPYMVETGGSSYWVYSNLGFRALVPSNIENPIKLNKEELNNLLLAIEGLFPS